MLITPPQTHGMALHIRGQRLPQVQVVGVLVGVLMAQSMQVQVELHLMAVVEAGAENQTVLVTA